MRYFKDQSGVYNAYEDYAVPTNPGEELTFEQLQELTKPAPVQKVRFSPLEFRERFTQAEQVAIRQASFTDMNVGLVYDSFLSADFIDVTDPRTAAGIDVYVTAGLLTADRKPKLLEPEISQS